MARLGGIGGVGPAGCQLGGLAVLLAANPPAVAPLVLAGPVTLEVRCTTASGADRAGMIPRARRLDDLTVSYTGDDVVEAFMAFNAMTCLVELVAFI